MACRWLVCAAIAALDTCCVPGGVRAHREATEATEAEDDRRNCDLASEVLHRICSLVVLVRAILRSDRQAAREGWVKVWESFEARRTAALSRRPRARLAAVASPPPPPAPPPLEPVRRANDRSRLRRRRWCRCAPARDYPPLEGPRSRWCRCSPAGCCSIPSSRRRSSPWRRARSRERAPRQRVSDAWPSPSAAWREPSGGSPWSPGRVSAVVACGVLLGADRVAAQATQAESERERGDLHPQVAHWHS